MIFRREEGKACIRYAHAAFAFPARPVTHQQIALRGLRREMTESSHPYWLVEVATNPKEGDQPWNANSGLNCTVW